MTINKGQREVTKVIISGDVAATLVADYSNAFWQIKPDSSPTASLAMSKPGRKLSEDNIRCGERDELPRTFTLSEDIDGSETDFDVSSTTGARIGRRFQILSTREVCEVGAACTIGATNLSAVTRGTAGTMGYAASSAAKSGDTCVWLDTPVQEAANTTLPKPQMWGAESLTNYIEERVEKLAFSRRKMWLIKNGGLQHGQTFRDYLGWQLERFKEESNLSLLYAKKGTLDGSEGVKTTTGGMPEFAAWSDYAFGDCNDRDNVEEKLYDVCEYADGDLYVACSQTAMLGFSQLYQGANPTNATGNVVRESGVRIEKISLPGVNVTLHLYKDPCLRDYVSDSVTYGQARAWNPKNVFWDYVAPVGRYEEADTGALVHGQYLYMIGGWRVINTKGIMIIAGITKS